MATDVTIHVNGDTAPATATVHMVGHTIQEGGTVNGCKLYNRETFKADGNVAADVQIAVQEPLSGRGVGRLAG
jgi:hypothetical protein